MRIYLCTAVVLAVLSMEVVGQVLGACSRPVEESLYGFRLRSFKNTGGNEIYVGTPDLGVGTNRQEIGAVWTAGANTLEAIYDVSLDELTVEVTNGNSTVYSITYQNISADVAARKTNSIDDADVLTISIAARDAGVTVALRDLAFNGVDLGDIQNSTGIATWTITGVDFSAGWSLDATVDLTGTFSNSQENSRIEFAFGVLDPSATVEVGSCPAVSAPCEFTTPEWVITPTFESFTGIQSLVFGLRTDGKPGAWDLTTDCELLNLSDAVGGFVLPELASAPSAYGWQYTIGMVSSDGKWLVGSATMNNADNADGNLNGYRHSSNDVNTGQPIDIANGTKIAVRWRVQQTSGGRGEIQNVEPIGVLTLAEPVGGGSSVATLSSAAFAPDNVVIDVHGDYLTISNAVRWYVEDTPGGNHTVQTQVGGVWGERQYNVQAVEPEQVLYLTQVLRTPWFGPARNLRTCDWYGVGVAIGVARNGQIGMWQIRHQATMNEIRLEPLANNQASEQYRDFSGRIDRDHGWTFHVDQSVPATYDLATNSGVIYAYALHASGTALRPYTAASPVVAGTRVNVTQNFDLNRAFGDNCNVVARARTIACGNLVVVPGKRAVVRCDDGGPVAYGSYSETLAEGIVEEDIDDAENSMRVVPNPVVGEATIENVHVHGTAQSVRVVTILGTATDVRVSVSAEGATFNAASLAPGAYMLEVVTATGAHRMPFIVR